MIELPNQKNQVIVQPSQCLGVILAGGLSSRMGKDKASLLRNETNMLSYSKQLLTGLGLNNIVISGETSTATQDDVIITDIHNESGPIGGIASVIEKLSPTSLFILPIDLPLMSVHVLQKLKQIGELSQQACFYDHNYLPLYLPVNAYTTNFLSDAFIQKPSEFKEPANKKVKNAPSMRSLLKAVPHKAINIEYPASLMNTNTPEEWAIAEGCFSKKRSQQLNPNKHNIRTKHV